MRVGHIRTWAVAALVSFTGGAWGQNSASGDGREVVPMPESKTVRELAVVEEEPVGEPEETAAELDGLIAQRGPGPGGPGPGGPGRGTERRGQDQRGGGPPQMD